MVTGLISFMVMDLYVHLMVNWYMVVQGFYCVRLIWVRRQKNFGHSDPDWSWGVINNLGYKNFKLSFQFDGVVGGVFHDYVRQKTLQGGRHLETVQGDGALPVMVMSMAVLM